MSFKRMRTTSELSSSTSSPPSGHTSKASRVISPPSSQSPGSTTHPLLCTLPPTCNPPRNIPTPLANTKDLESHYATYHAHVCEQPKCGCVFPDARLLELHQTECHDPIAAIRKDKGEKIFACHLPSCPRLFLSPKARRLHLIQTHAFPKEYFFAVTNKGIGGLLKRWGEGASMIRGPWKRREEAAEAREQDHDNDDDGGDVSEDKRASDVNEEVDDAMHEETANGFMHDENLSSPDTHRTNGSQDFRANTPTGGHDTDSDALDHLAQSMTSLSLVPPSIRFGRGGKNGGFVHRGVYHPNVTGPIDGRNKQADKRPQVHAGRGRGAVHPAVVPRGRGRGRGVYGNVGSNGPGRNEHGTLAADLRRDDRPVVGVTNGGGIVRQWRGVGRAGIIQMRGRANFVSRARGRGRGGGRGFVGLDTF